jgi:MFS family permease
LVILVVPISVLGFVLAFFNLPSTKPYDQKLALSIKEHYLGGFKQVFTNKSSTALLFGLLFATAATMFATYAISFLKIRFLISTNLGSIILLSGALVTTMGSLATGVLVPRFGRKPVLVICGFFSSVFMMPSFYVPDMWLGVTLRFLAVWFGSIAFTSGTLLALEQVPKFRSTMMSLSAAFGSAGAVVGVVMGGMVLDSYKSFGAMGLAFGGMGLIAVPILIFFVKDPMRKLELQSKNVSDTKRFSMKVLAILAVTMVAIAGVGVVAIAQSGLFSQTPPVVVTPSPSISPSPSSFTTASPSPSTTLIQPPTTAPSSSSSTGVTASPSVTSGQSPSPVATSSPSTSVGPSPSPTTDVKFYTTPIISAAGTVISLPYNFVRDNGIVYVDLKLETSVTSVLVNGRTIPLSQYRDGGYLPLLIIVTPQLHVIAAVRGCEWCKSSGYHIVNGVMDCDVCHSTWNLDTFEGLSGMCRNYPPPPLSASVAGDNISVDFSQLQVKVIS